MDVLLAAQPAPALPPRPSAAGPSRRTAASVLGLEPEEADPVRIVQAAQLRLRRYRRGGRPAANRDHVAEMHRIAEARDQLLCQSVGQLTAQIRGSGSGRIGDCTPPASGPGVA
jgi:hypothetical protein